MDVDAKETKRLEQVTKDFLEKIKEYYSRELLAALDKYVKKSDLDLLRKNYFT